ncbi:hypothetical protein IQ255_25670 [Pleurocapsales cyanobacterium LEGE 10410]|nr:hypothetical protein [Pleurocapsales cyanobacterium LEGE 10410]
MNHNPFHFFKELLKRPIYEVLWVFYMMAINLYAIAFWDEPLAKTIVIVFMISSMFMMGLYSKFGFTKILGLGHILWIPLVLYIALSLPAASGLYFTYLIVLLGTLSISIVIDMYDVWSYYKENTD